MMPTSPHYLLFSEASRDQQSAPCWRFVLQNVETQRRFSATDTEPTEGGERLELLAVVRGLEALDGPARVTLVTKSRYVSRGIKSGLAEWRRNEWSWERFGRMVPIRDHDLWQRVDRALGFHKINCQAWHFDSPVEVEESQASSESLAMAVEPCVRRRTRLSRGPARILASNPAARTPMATSPAGGLIARVRNKMPRVGHLPEVVRALARPLGRASGASA